MAAKPLGSLLSNSWSAYLKAMGPIFVASLLLAVIAGFVFSMIGEQVEQQVATIMSDEGVDVEQLERLMERVMQGDAEAQRELEQLAEQQAAQYEGMTEEQIAAQMSGRMMQFWKGMLPVLGLSALIFVLISLLAYTFFFILAVHPALDGMKAAGKVPGLFLPMVGLSLWVFLRTFAWIPFIGPLFAIILYPRFVTAPVRLIRDNKGVFQSASMSYTDTRGYWGKIFGNMLVVSILVGLATIALNFGLGLLSAPMGSSLVTATLSHLVTFLMTGFIAIFVVQLALTVIANPRKL